jgi:hypothetical protein
VAVQQFLKAIHGKDGEKAHLFFGVGFPDFERSSGQGKGKAWFQSMKCQL